MRVRRWPRRGRDAAGGDRHRARGRRPDRRAARGVRRRGGDVPVLGDAAARAALAGGRHRRRPADAAAPAGPPRRRTAGPAAAGRGDHGALAAAADGARPRRDRAGDAAGRRRARLRRAGRRGSSSWPTPGSTWSASAASSPSAAASSTSSRRPPSIRCASSSGATRSPRCGCSRSPTSARSRRSTSQTVVAVPCRELLLTDDVRARAAELVDRRAPRDDNRVTGGVGEMLAKLAEGIPVDGMEALQPVLRPDDARAADRPAARRAPRCWCATRRRCAPAPPT